MPLNKTESTFISDSVSTLEAMTAELETIRDKYQESFDNKGEKAQESEKGQEHSELNDKLSAAYDALESAHEALGELNGI